MRVILILLLILPLQLFSQEKRDTSELRGSASFFSNTPSLPLSGNVFVPPYHAGLDLGLSSPFEVQKRGRWEWNADLAYYYHRLSHHGIHLRGGVRYRRIGLSDSGEYGFSWELAVKGGYLHMFMERPSYEFNEETGEYERSSPTGRSQFSFGVSTGPTYRFPKAPEWETFLNYRIWMQTPFVQNYVPILPNIALHIGMRFELPSKSSQGS